MFIRPLWIVYSRYHLSPAALIRLTNPLLGAMMKLSVLIRPAGLICEPGGDRNARSPPARGVDEQKEVTLE